MAILPTFKFYSDSGLTTELSTALTFVATPGVTVNVDKQIFFGSVVANRILQESTSPGVNQINFTIVDLDIGTAVELTDFVVADTLIGLDTSILQDIDIGVSRSSGAGSRQELWIRYTPPLAFTGNDVNLRCSILNLIETELIL